jgi:hypothetical protein
MNQGVGSGEWGVGMNEIWYGYTLKAKLPT